MWAERATGESIAEIELLARKYFEGAQRAGNRERDVPEGEALELDAFRIGLAMALVLYQKALSRDRGHRGAQVSYRAPSGDLVALEFQGYTTRKVKSVLGPVSLERAYYHQDGTEHSRWPREEELGWLANEDWTPLLQRWVAEDAVDGSFKPTIEKMNERFGLSLSYGSSQTLCTELGTFLVKQQRQEADALCAPGSHPEQEAQYSGKRPEMMVVTTDGTGAPVRNYDEKTREVKLGAVYLMSPSRGQEPSEPVEAYVQKGLSPTDEAHLLAMMSMTAPDELKEVPRCALCPEQPPALQRTSGHRGERGQPSATGSKPVRQAEVELAAGEPKPPRPKLRIVRPDETPPPSKGWEKIPDSTRYVATIQNSKVMGRLLYWLAVQMGYLQAKVVVYLADGAKWCWNEMRTHFPDAIGILDNYHLREKVEEAARKIFGEHQAVAAGVWARCVFSLLVHGQVGRIIKILEKLEVPGETRKAGVKLLLSYLKNNRQQMDYPRYLALGLPIGSGVVEGGAKFVIGSRVKGSGRRWILQGAAAMAALRAERCSRRFLEAWRAYRQAKLAA